MPRVNVTRDWKLLPASSGTIDNNGVVPVEISQDKEVGIVIHPKSRFSYMNVELYIKSHKQDTIRRIVTLYVISSVKRSIARINTMLNRFVTTRTAFLPHLRIQKGAASIPQREAFP